MVDEGEENREREKKRYDSFGLYRIVDSTKWLYVGRARPNSRRLWDVIWCVSTRIILKCGMWYRRSVLTLMSISTQLKSIRIVDFWRLRRARGKGLIESKTFFGIPTRCKNGKKFTDVFFFFFFFLISAKKQCLKLYLRIKYRNEHRVQPYLVYWYV